MLFKLKEVKRDKRFEIRLAKTEKHILETECGLLHMDLTEYIMRCALSKPIRYWNTAVISLQLMKIVDQQRDIWKLDKSHEDLQRLILNSVAVAFRDMPEKVHYKNPCEYVTKAGEAKSARVAIRLTERDWEKIKNKAQETEKSVSEYVSFKALARPKSPEIIIEIESQLKQFQNMLSDLITHSLLRSPIYLTVQNELLTYIESLLSKLHKDCYITSEAKPKKG